MALIFAKVVARLAGVNHILVDAFHEEHPRPPVPLPVLRALSLRPSTRLHSRLSWAPSRPVPGQTGRSVVVHEATLGADWHVLAAALGEPVAGCGHVEHGAGLAPANALLVSGDANRTAATDAWDQALPVLDQVQSNCTAQAASRIRTTVTGPGGRT